MSSSTTLVAIRFKNFVITTADGRVGSSRYSRALMYDMVKTIPVGKRACVSVSGDLNLIPKLEGVLDTKFGAHQGVNAKEVADFVYETTMEFAKKTDAANTVIVVGHGEKGGFEMHEIVSKAGSGSGNGKTTLKKITERYVVRGSGETYLTAHMKKSFGDSKKKKKKKTKTSEDCDENENMTEDEAFEFLMAALNLAVEGDWGTGGLFSCIIINADGIRDKFQHQDNPPYVVYNTADG